MIISPSIGSCKTEPKAGYWYGGGRNNAEKKIGKKVETADEWKKENLVEIQSRLKGWQLESFTDSYKHKMENGISLYKKKITNE